MDRKPRPGSMTMTSLVLSVFLFAAPLKAQVRVLASVLPLGEFAASVAGERGEVELLLPPGAGVHTWQPRPGDIRRLAAGDLLIYVGANLEPWLTGMLRAVPGGKVRTLEAGRGLVLMEEAGHHHDEEEGGHHEHLDPHIWLDFELDIQIVNRIAEELSAIDPDGREVFRSNADRLADRLRELDLKYREALAECRGRDIILAGHGAFGYLARRYGLVQRALYGLSPDSQPRPADLIRAVEHCREKGIKTIFFENSVPPDLARTLAREIGGQVLVLHAGHNLTKEQRARGDGFFDLMEENLKNLRNGLGCR
jgi:zinc transport system substrate-binding protein